MRAQPRHTLLGATLSDAPSVPGPLFSVAAPPSLFPLFFFFGVGVSSDKAEAPRFNLCAQDLRGAGALGDAPASAAATGCDDPEAPPAPAKRWSNPVVRLGRALAPCPCPLG